MLSPLAIAATLWLAQVPPPDAASTASDALHAEREAIRAREAEALEALAARLEGQGQTAEAREVRLRVEPPPPTTGPSRFVPLPEYVPAQADEERAARPPAPAEAETILGEAASSFLALAGKAAGATVRRYSLADACLREVLQRRPDDPEARRLLGFVPYEGGWATPFAAEQLRRGLVLHLTFGWVPADWVPHLDRGELPGVVENGRPREWLPAAQADALRADFFRKPWQISTEHFQIYSNAPLAEVIAFGRRLEDFHDLFFALLGDVIGRERLPLAQRFANPKLAPKAPAARSRHEVWFLASKQEYVDYLRPMLGEGVQDELGHYLEAGRYAGRQVPARSYFFRDPNAQIAAEGTLFHEASHQLLFESAGRSRFERNTGNFWLWEALGTYFETVEPLPDGTLEYGGLVGPRIYVTERLALDGKLYIPLETLTTLDRTGFYDEARLFTDPKEIAGPEGIRRANVYYDQSMALAIFLMHYEGGKYREDFLDYVRDAYDGKVNTTDHSLAVHLGVPFATLDRQFLEFLRAGRTEPAEEAAPER